MLNIRRAQERRVGVHIIKAVLTCYLSKGDSMFQPVSRGLREGCDYDVKLKLNLL